MMAKSVNTPEEKKRIEIKPVYLKSKSKGFRKTSNIVTDYDLQYNDAHETVIVEIGTRDLDKEVQSHIGEVGLYNVIKQAIAHGQDPYLAFRKDEPGIPFAIDENATMDDIVNGANLNKAKLEEFAKGLGLTVDDLVKALNEGTVQDLLTKAVSEQANKTTDKEGE